MKIKTRLEKDHDQFVEKKLFYIAFFPKLALAFLHPMQGGKKETQEKELIIENSLLDVWFKAQLSKHGTF